MREAGRELCPERMCSCCGHTHYLPLTAALLLLILIGVDSHGSPAAAARIESDPTSDFSGAACRDPNGRDDSQILQVFKSQLVDSGEPDLGSWQSSNLTSWRGVRWRDGADNPSAEALELPGLGLQGHLPASLQDLVGLVTLNLSRNEFNGTLAISPCMLNLTVLDLSSNLLVGTLPSSLSSLQSLRSLILAHNFLSGGFMQEILGLQSLRELNLSGNNLTGELSADVSGLQGLRVIDLSRNFISGVVPKTISALSWLTALVLSHNNLTGTIPAEIGQLQKLQYLSLGSNSLSQEIPPNITQLSSLRALDLSDNFLSGPIPEDIGRLASMTHLDLDSNKLEGQLPSSLGNCSELVHIHISWNQLTGPLSLAAAEFPKLLVLNMGYNRFSGGLDLNFGGLRNLEFLYLPGNQLGGAIPAEVGMLQSLQILILRQNNFLGEIPKELGNCTSFQELWLDSNSLVGGIPDEIFRLGNLNMLVLAQNNLAGGIPFGLANCTNLHVLWLEENSFSGSIPHQLANLTNLLMLSVASNQLVGSIPSSIGGLQALVGMDFGNNRLTGGVPDSLAGLASIQFLFLSQNELGGSELSWIGNLSTLRALDLSMNEFTGFPQVDFSKLRALTHFSRYSTSPPSALVHTADGKTYEGFALPTTFDFSRNKIVGLLPPEIGQLQNLQVLNLSQNILSGAIPSSLGNLSALLKLDLSSNNFSGTIPTTLTHLSFLSTLNLSFNHLFGEIPKSGQFSTFSRSAYLGNQDLCGPPLKFCLPSASSPSSHSSRREPILSDLRKLLPVYVAIAAVIGFCSFWIFMLRNFRCRKDLQVDQPVNEKVQTSFSSSIFRNSLLVQLNAMDLAFATNHYSPENIIGDGGFGLVYRATLADGSSVAVKKLVIDGVQGEHEFVAEMKTLGKIRHKNLVSLLGYCHDGNDRILVYEYMENGSLDTWLHCREEGLKPLSWFMRLMIAKGAAEGLSFLHNVCFPPIIHRDIKVSNILLDEHFEAHIADFGLARLMHLGDTHVSTDVAGTVGYVPPEYSQMSIATIRGDVFSFGVLLLEIITGKRPTDAFFQNCGGLTSWVQNNENLSLGVDKILADTGPIPDMLEFMKIACLCCQEVPSKRPNMMQVLHMLDALSTSMECKDSNFQPMGGDVQR